jgi:manganese transport protein
MENQHSASLSEVHESVDTSGQMSNWKKFMAFLGPAYLVSVGYMDPGNWATDLAGGSQFGYQLIWVLLMSNLIALLLQSFCARLGIVRGLDLAQASRATYPKWMNICLYALAEIAIAACDLAEVVGMAIGLQLLFHLPLLLGVAISVLDTFIILFLLNYGIKKIEALILGLVGIIGMCFLGEMFFAHPNLGEVAVGFVPTALSENALYIAIGIIGATVMPHNLYLHSSLVQTRKFQRTPEETRKAIKYNIIDSAIALNFAFFVNAAILILAATAFYKNGMFEIAEIQDAHRLLAPILGSSYAPIFFAVALIAAGQSSTITGTLAGQVVMEGYLNLRIQPWLRRLITRMIAIVPAFLTIYFVGEAATGKLLVMSQVVLSLQLGFATIPLIHFVSDKEKMGEFVIPLWQKILAWLGAGIIVLLNIRMVYGQIIDLIQNNPNIAFWLKISIVPLAILVLLLLVFVTIEPLVMRAQLYKIEHLHDAKQPLIITQIAPYQRIAISVDFSTMDTVTINQAIAQGGKTAQYLLVHVVESAGARWLGSDIKDFETQTDKAYLNEYAQELAEQGYQCTVMVGFGNRTKEIPRLVKAFKADFLVMGGHGHQAFMDFILGSTISEVRHQLTIPVLIVQ